MTDIDRRIMAVPLFPNLWRFPEGQEFKQWTSNDSKALMKVFLPAILGHVPTQMVHAVSAFMEFCYLVRRSVLTDSDLDKISDIISTFHEEWKIFEQVGVRPDGISLLQQHSMVHYNPRIMDFGAPNGLCSSITESKRIEAVKDPYWCTNRYEALGQMLTINQ